MKRWRIAENEWNLKAAPWLDAVGIEEMDDEMRVPALVCWFTRPGGLERAQEVVKSHNYFVEACEFLATELRIKP